MHLSSQILNISSQILDLSSELLNISPQILNLVPNIASLVPNNDHLVSNNLYLDPDIEYLVPNNEYLCYQLKNKTWRKAYKGVYVWRGEEEGKGEGVQNTFIHRHCKHTHDVIDIYDVNWENTRWSRALPMSSERWQSKELKTKSRGMMCISQACEEFRDESFRFLLLRVKNLRKTI